MTIFDADDLVIAEKTTFARFYFSCAAFLREFRIIPAGFAPTFFPRAVMALRLFSRPNAIKLRDSAGAVILTSDLLYRASLIRSRGRKLTQIAES